MNDAVTQEEINDHKYREVVTIRKQLLMSNDKLDIIKAVNFWIFFPLRVDSYLESTITSFY